MTIKTFIVAMTFYNDSVARCSNSIYHFVDYLKVHPTYPTEFSKLITDRTLDYLLFGSRMEGVFLSMHVNFAW